MSDRSSNPFPGPRPFKPEEYAIFAGRDHEISELSSLIVAHPVTLLYAQSGAGKTSLLNAGLVPALKDKGFEVLPTSRVGIPIPQTVNIQDVRNVYTFSAIGDLLPSIPDEDPWLQRATLLEAVGRIPRVKDEAGEPALRVIAFDQFEEMFSTYPERWQNRREFFDQVTKALHGDIFLRVLFLLREDYWAAFASLAGVLPENGRTQYHLERLGKFEALLAITRPLEGTKWSFGRKVAETLVEDLMAIVVEDPSGGTVNMAGEFVEPVQLQVVCYTLFEKLPPGKTEITLDDLRAFGNPDEALQLFYEKAIDSAVAKAKIDEGELRSWFETYLITPAGTRGLVFLGKETAGGIPRQVIDELEAQHLIRPELRSGSRWYELTHDRFIRPIQKSNLEWKSDRWSTSFEVQYTGAIRKAVAEAGISESALRKLLDSMVTSDGTRLSRAADPAVWPALDALVEAGLLRSETLGESKIYTPLHDSIAQAIQVANQAWQAMHWSGARSLRRLENRARRWARATEKKKAVGRADLLMQADLRDGETILRKAADSGIPVSKSLKLFVKTSPTKP